MEAASRMPRSTVVVARDGGKPLLLASPGWTRSRWCKHSLLHQAATYVRCGVENIYSYRENRRLNRSARNEATRTARQSLKTRPAAFRMQGKLGRSLSPRRP